MQNIFASGIHHLERRAGIVVAVLKRALEQFNGSRSHAWGNGENDALAVAPTAFFDKGEVFT